MSTDRKPANDQHVCQPTDYEAVCKCGGSFFKIVMRDGLNYVLCAQCEHDHTMTTIWAKGPLDEE